MSRLIVKNLPKKITDQRIRELFGQKGRITDVQLKYTKEGIFRRFCFVGYETDEEAQKALSYFNGSFVDTSKVTVEICAALGGITKSAKHNVKVQEEDDSHEKRKKKKKANKEKEEEIVGEHRDDPEFQEFLKVHSVGNKTVWDNDTSIANGEQQALHKEERKESENEEDARSEASEEEAEQLQENGTKIADKDISDLEYMKSLMQKKDTEDQSQQSPEKIPTKNKSTKEKDVNFFTLKVFNLPYNVKRKDIIKFFKPLKLKSLRLPVNGHGYCYVGFKDKKDSTKALLKHKSFLGERQISVVDFTEQNKITLKRKLGMADEGNTGSGVNPKWQKQRDSIASEEAISESGKIYFRNLTYSVTEEDIQKLFEKYGPVAEVNLPVDANTRKIKGFGTVAFMFPEHAILAFNELDGHTFHGRMLHLLPAKADKEKSEETDDTNAGSYKMKKERELKKTAGQSHNWNTLFLGANAVADILARNYDTTKEHILDSEAGGTSAAVRLALGETQIVSELRKFLEDNGVQLKAFEESKGKKIRSKTVILAKNLPAHTDTKELHEIFSKFGILGRIILPPSGVTALIEFVEPSEAKKAFTKLAYSKFKDAPLYLEWAPENIFLTGNEKSRGEVKKEVEKGGKESQKESPQKVKDEEEETKEAAEEEESEAEEDIDPEPDTTIFLRNLNFSTREESIRKHFARLNPIHMVQVAMKKDPENPQAKVSLGYGFIQFKRKASAETALKTMQFTQIDGNKVELKKSDRVLKSQVQSVQSRNENKRQDTKKQTGSKILVRNIPFQAKEKEVREIFKAFGELRSVRLPLKVTPGEKTHRGFGFVDFFSKSDAKNAFKNLSQSTHLYGRRLVLEWAAADEDVTQLRKRTADHFVDMKGPKRSKKSIFSANDQEKSSAKKSYEDSDEDVTVEFE
ncbi:probable RNA-binding protein 19 [Lutzomyia longipalpis]|uniref:probable RNA-binding protein 19 n=1 Tax=Lutzomyia longipalpis TaxID=7200 RepID=UPI002483DFEE|nr:probable RNA-binding protein 19 [Lutzomyia longipalpis]